MSAEKAEAKSTIEDRIPLFISEGISSTRIFHGEQLSMLLGTHQDELDPLLFALAESLHPLVFERKQSVGIVSPRIRLSTLGEHIEEIAAAFKISNQPFPGLHVPVELKSAMLTMVCLEILKEIIRIVQKDAFDSLTSIASAIKYWKSVRFQSSFYFQQGPSFLLSHFLPGAKFHINDPGSTYERIIKKNDQGRMKVPVSVTPWLRYAGFARYIHLEDKLSILSRMQDSLTTFLGRLQRELMELSRITFFKDRASEMHLKLLQVTEYLKDFMNDPISNQHKMSTAVNEQSISNVACKEAEWQAMEEIILKTRELIDISGSFNEKINSLWKPFDRPSHFIRYWLPYTVGFLSFSYIAYKLLVAGPGFLFSLVSKFRSKMDEFYQEHVAEPFKVLYKRLTNLNNKEDLQKSIADVEQSKGTLRSMLYAFGKSDLEVISENEKSSSSSPEQKDKASTITLEDLRKRSDGLDMSIVMKRYEKEIHDPLINIARGEIVRAVLIQLQKLKVDIESAIVQLDMLIEENDINIQLLAIVPAIVLAYPVYFFIQSRCRQRLYAKFKGSKKMKRCIGRIQERLIRGYPGNACGIFESLSDTGRIVFEVNQILKIASEQRKKHMVSGDDFQRILEDSEILQSDDLDVSQKRLFIENMFRNHKFLSFIPESN